MNSMSTARLAAAVFATVVCLVSHAFAAADYYLEIKGVRGDSVTVPGAFDVLSFSWGVSNSTSVGSGGHGSGKASFSDINAVIDVSKAGPALVRACATGAHIDEVVLTIPKSLATSEKNKSKIDPNARDYLVITMNDVVVSSYQSSGSSGDGSSPLNSISLNFGKITYSYKVGNETVEEYTIDLRTTTL